MAARQRKQEWTRHTLDGRDCSTARRAGRVLAAAADWRAEAMVGILGRGRKVARF
jgi:hypothetical protein